MGNAQRACGGGKFWRCIRVQELAFRPVQKVLERSNFRFCRLVWRGVASSEPGRSVIYEECVSVNRYGATGFGLGDNVICSDLFAESTRSLTELPFVRLLLHFCHLTRRTQRVLGQMGQEVMKRSRIGPDGIGRRGGARGEKVGEGHRRRLRRRDIPSVKTGARRRWIPPNRQRDVWHRLEAGSMHASKRAWRVTRYENAERFGRHRRRRSRHTSLNVRNILADNQRNLGSVRRHQRG